MNEEQSEIEVAEAMPGEARGEEPLARTGPAEATDAGPEVTRYRVANAQPLTFFWRGQKTKLQPDKVVDARSYDLDELRRQGAQLEPIGGAS